MAMPDFQTLMLPLLRLCADGKETSRGEVMDGMAAQFHLTEQERAELLPSGSQHRFENRVAWARSYMIKAGLLESTRRGHFRITSRGTETLAGNPTRIDIKYLQQYPEFVEFKAAKSSALDETPTAADEPRSTPQEALEGAYQELRSSLEADLLKQVKTCSPQFFERLVVDLLVKMGYGGSLRDAGKAIGQSGDGGIDGIIKEDRLGLGIIYIQAKRWDGTIGRPEIQKFAGALQGQRAKRGVFITTSSFSSEAVEYAGRIDTRIALIEGKAMASLMVDHNVGVSGVASYEVKRMDSDYFVEE